jgi:hypothetical protein
MNKNIIIGVIAGVLIVGGGSFYGGMKYAGANASGNRNLAAAGQPGQFRIGQNGMGMRNGQGMGSVTAGQIIAKDNTSITVKLPDGGSKIVFLTASTTVTKNTSGSVNDLVVNENVVVNGSANSDGSINAQSIQLGSVIRFNQGQNRPVGNSASQ